MHFSLGLTLGSALSQVVIVQYLVHQQLFTRQYHAEVISHKIYQHLPAVALSKKYGCDSGPMPAAFSAWMVTLYLL